MSRVFRSTCPQCGEPIEVSKKEVGQMRKCRACGNMIMLRFDSATVSAAKGRGCLAQLLSLAMWLIALGILALAAMGWYAYSQSKH
jgi:hypothetical protein